MCAAPLLKTLRAWGAPIWDVGRSIQSASLMLCVLGKTNSGIEILLMMIRLRRMLAWNRCYLHISGVRGRGEAGLRTGLGFSGVKSLYVIALNPGWEVGPGSLAVGKTICEYWLWKRQQQGIWFAQDGKNGNRNLSCLICPSFWLVVHICMHIRGLTVNFWKYFTSTLVY